MGQQRAIERRQQQHYGGHPRGLNRGYNQSSVPVPSSGGSGGGSAHNNNATGSSGPSTSIGRHQYGSSAIGQSQGRPSYLQGSSASYLANSGGANHLSSSTYHSRPGGTMLTSPNAGHGTRQ